MSEISVKSNAAATTRHERHMHVLQMRANFSIEGIEPMADDLFIQERYIDGTASLAGLLEHAREYARLNRDADTGKTTG